MSNPLHSRRAALQRLSAVTVAASTLSATALFGAGNALAAAAWPSKPIRMIVPYTPGGGTDAVTRQISERLSNQNRWNVIVDNKPGAGGNIGMDAVAKASPDGYTVGMGQTANLAINPSLLPSMPFNAQTDLIPVALVAAQPMVLVVPINSKWTSVKDLVAAAKAEPGSIKQALASTGTVGHLAGEMLSFKAGIKVLNIPYRGAAPAVTELLGGQTQYMFATPQAVYALVKANKLKAIAVSSKERLPILPDVPTVAESGYPGFEAVDWKLVVAPKGTSAEVAAQLNAAVNKALQDPHVQKQLHDEGSTPLGGTVQQAVSYLQKEQQVWSTLIRDAKITIE